MRFIELGSCKNCNKFLSFASKLWSLPYTFSHVYWPKPSPDTLSAVFQTKSFDICFFVCYQSSGSLSESLVISLQSRKEQERSSLVGSNGGKTSCYLRFTDPKEDWWLKSSFRSLDANLPQSQLFDELRGMVLNTYYHPVVRIRLTPSTAQRVAQGLGLQDPGIERPISHVVFRPLDRQGNLYLLGLPTIMFLCRKLMNLGTHLGTVVIDIESIVEILKSPKEGFSRVPIDED